MDVFDEYCRNIRFPPSVLKFELDSGGKSNRAASQVTTTTLETLQTKIKSTTDNVSVLLAARQNPTNRTNPHAESNGEVCSSRIEDSLTS